METTHSETDGESIPDLARKVAKCFQAAQESIRKSYWVEYGQYQEQLEEAIRDLSTALELEKE